MKTIKNAKQLERHFKGVANHRRIEVLRLLHKTDGLTLDGIAQLLDANFKTISEHTRKLVLADLVSKKYKGRAVIHTLSPFGRKFLAFMKTF